MTQIAGKKKMPILKKKTSPPPLRYMNCSADVVCYIVLYSPGAYCATLPRYIVLFCPGAATVLFCPAVYCLLYFICCYGAVLASSGSMLYDLLCQYELYCLITFWTPVGTCGEDLGEAS